MKIVLPSVNPDGLLGPGGWVRVDDVWGDDALVDRVARVSTATSEAPRTPEQIRRLIRFLMRHEHSSPFGFPQVRIEFRVPIFIARQAMRHRTWEYSETSGRYAELPADVYVPAAFRVQAKSNRQSSTLSPDLDQSAALRTYLAGVRAAQAAYADLLAQGVAREQARAVLPLGTMTHFFGAVDLRNLLHFLHLRLAPGAQEEFRALAVEILEGIRPAFPETIAAWERYVLNTRRVRREEALAMAGDAFVSVRQDFPLYTDNTQAETDEFAAWLEGS